MSWEERWQARQTPWDQGGSAPALVELVSRGVLPEGKALVPGAGAGHDVLTLASPQREVIGLDIAPSAIERFEELRLEAAVAVDSARMVHADFFGWVAPHQFDLIYDYTFLCALDPGVRSGWAERVDELLAPQGELLTLIFPSAPPHGAPGQPPFLLTPQMVGALLQPAFEPIELVPAAVSVPSRVGREWVGRWRRRA